MTVTVHGPLATPTGVTTTLQAGGSLAQNTTYYIRIIAQESSYVSTAYQVPNRYSAPSTEVSFTTDTTNLSCKIDWNSVTDADGYAIYITTTSGDYKKASVGNTKVTGTGGSNGFTATTNTYTITSTSTSNALHTFVLAEDDLYPFTGELGSLYVTFDGTTTLQDIKDAIDTAGYSSYCAYKARVFNLKGSIYVTGSNSGSLTVLRHILNFVHGTIINNNSNVAITFGEKDASSNVTRNGCDISIFGWLPNFILDDDAVIMYASSIRSTKVTTAAAVVAGAFNTSVGGVQISGKSSTSENNLFDFISADSPISNSTYFYSRIYPKQSSITYEKIIGHLAGLSYEIFHWHTYDDNIFRDCKFYSQDIHIQASGSASSSTMNFEDTKFYDENGVELNKPFIFWGTNGIHVYKFKRGFKPKVIDKNGNPLQGVSITLKDNTSSTVATGTTDVNGEVSNTYVEVKRWEHNGSSSGSDKTTPSLTAETDFSPMVVTLEKEGYNREEISFTFDFECDDWLLSMGLEKHCYEGEI